MEMGFTDSWLLEQGDSRRALRPLGWSELCARLVAAHDMRRALAPAVTSAIPSPGPGQHISLAVRKTGSECSFHDSAARMLQNIGGEPKVPVNPASSTNRNDGGGNVVASPNEALQGRPDETRHD